MSVEILEHFGLAHFFTDICGATMDGSRSTKEDVIAYLFGKNKGEGKILMVGDTVYDILGAKAHGIPAIGVAWGYGNVQDMTEAGAIAIAESTEELLALLNKE
jgi:phosphoglycolate phosphatase